MIISIAAKAQTTDAMTLIMITRLLQRQIGTEFLKIVRICYTELPCKLKLNSARICGYGINMRERRAARAGIMRVYARMRAGT